MINNNTAVKDVFQVSASGYRLSKSFSPMSNKSCSTVIGEGVWTVGLRSTRPVDGLLCASLNNDDSEVLNDINDVNVCGSVTTCDAAGVDASSNEISVPSACSGVWVGFGTESLVV